MPGRQTNGSPASVVLPSPLKNHTLKNFIKVVEKKEKIL